MRLKAERTDDFLEIIVCFGGQVVTTGLYSKHGTPNISGLRALADDCRDAAATIEQMINETQGE